MHEVGVPGYVHQLRKRRLADVSYQFRRKASPFQDLVDERSGCALTLGTCNADDLVPRIVAEENLRMGRQQAPGFPGSRNLMCGGRDSWCFNDDFALSWHKRVQIAWPQIQARSRVLLEPAGEFLGEFP